MVQLVSFPGSITVFVPYKKLGMQGPVDSAILHQLSLNVTSEILLRLALVNVV